MTVETYMQLREYGSDSWSRVLPTLFVSDRVSTWLPSGHDIQGAYDKGLIPFSHSGFIDLIEAKIIRVGARTTSYDPNFSDRLMFKYDETDPIQKYFHTLIDIGNYSDFLYLHEPSDAARLAREQIKGRRNLGSARYYVTARKIVDRYLEGRGVLHPMVEQRAGEFALMNTASAISLAAASRVS
jgi:hypothetical protein